VVNIEARDHPTTYGREREVHIPNTPDENEGLVFVHSIQFVSYCERIIRRSRGMVRLKPLDESTGGSRLNSLYLSTVTTDFGFLPRFFSQNRKADSALMGSSVLVTGQEPSDMIKREPKMMRNSPGDCFESKRDLPSGVL
jgi:hypothetical protein